VSEPAGPGKGTAPAASWQPAYIALGSNLEGPRAQVLRAAERLRELPLSRLIRLSPLYESRPLGPVAQPDFINAVAGLLTQLEPEALLDQLKAIETTLGRPPVHPRWGPRIIDLDLLVHGRASRSTERLTLPHPGIVERNFVLYPLADIAPDLAIPGLGGRVSELKERVGPGGLRLLDGLTVESGG
jgi:2-amino-4-hydroxy-6-hydroxymethyldihydropteridine diphosphokinase